MKKFILGTLLAIVFSGCAGCSSINTIFDDNKNAVKASSNPAAEREFEKHDTYKPWWSK